MFATEILAAKYAETDVKTVADAQVHLTIGQRQQLLRLLEQFPKLFSNDLKVYPGKKVHLELKDGARPVYKRHYPIADLGT